MTSTEYDLGVAAFAAGLPCAPALDPALTARLGALGTNAPAMRRWLAGWTAANLAAELPA